MSYARFGDGDVYVYLSTDGRLECVMCALGDVCVFCDRVGARCPSVQASFDSTDGMIAHLAAHRAAGHSVPDGIEDALRADDATNFPRGER